MAVKHEPIVTPRSVTNEFPEGAAGFFAKAKSLLTGMAITARAAGRKPITVRYPAERLVVSPRWRGALRLRGALGKQDIELLATDTPSYNAEIERLHGLDRLPPCVGNCPANVDARGQSFLIADNRVGEAYELVRQRNVMPGVLGRICHHPCEANCRRNFYDEPIAIRPLHRFAFEQFQSVRPETLTPLPNTQGKRVAIIGSGPSGLAAALDLMRLGYGVVMYEKDPSPGGALRTGVPVYRLPRDVLAREIADIVEMGMELKCGVDVGVDEPLESIARQYDAVLLAVGLQTSRILPIPGADATGVRGALEVLRAGNETGETGVRGKRVFVVGGGNVAVDAARVALRGGASEVRLASLESSEEMPAHPWEIAEAADEGVIMTCSVGPEEVLAEDGAVVGMRMRECLSVFDEAGRFSPKFGENLTDFPCDVVIFAIGQAAKLDTLVSGSQVAVSEQGRLVVDGSALTTSLPGVFACGEVVTGPGSAIGSIASGHEAAISIHRYVQGQPVESEDRVRRPVPPVTHYGPVDLRLVEDARRRPAMPFSPPEERVTDFRPVELGLSYEDAMAEATRCLRCESEVCVGCTFCARTCPDLALRVERDDTPGARALTCYELDLTLCSFCGLCAEQCPTRALAHTGQYELSFYSREFMTFDADEMLRDPSGTRATGVEAREHVGEIAE